MMIDKNQKPENDQYLLDPEVMDLFKRMKQDSMASLEESRLAMWGNLKTLMTGKTDKGENSK